MPGAAGIARRAIRRAARLLPRGPRPAILMYHRVAEESFDPWGLAVSPSRFADQLAWLKANRTVLPLAEFAARQRKGTLPSNAAALTFDDGYECTASVAAPMLEQAGLPATIFIPVELIERGAPFWWDELQRIVITHADNQIVFRGELIPLGPSDVRDNGWAPQMPPSTPRQQAFLKIWATLREMPPSTLDRAIHDLIAQSPDGETSNARPMTATQLRETASELVHIGSHALTHPWLTSLAPAEQRREISESVERCASLSGVRPATFAYPYGNFDAECVNFVREAGFECACATLPTSVTRKSNPFVLPRIQVGNWPAQGLARAVAGAP